MDTYVIMLRGINVSGQKKVPMAELRQLLSDLEFEHVQTYIQSGNIILTTKMDADELRATVEQSIKSHFGFDVPAIVISPDELKSIIDNNPFLDGSRDLERIYVTFLNEAPDQDRLRSFGEVDYSPEEFIPSGKTIYGHSPNGFARAKLNNNFYENKLKVTATTRNWRSVNKLMEMCNGN